MYAAPQRSRIPADASNMTETGVLTARIDAAVAAAIADLGRARTILSDAMSRLLATFTRLRSQLAEEHQLFEQTLARVNGTGPGGGGLVGVLRDVLSRFVDDMVRIGASSVKIMVELEALRRHTQRVSTNGVKIEQIAGATRILSLNARIEAQRIGSAGAVFRVVADEIKLLAIEAGELSKAVRNALTVQSTSLANTSAAVSQLAASDLDQAVVSHQHLDDTIAKLSEMSAESLRILARIQGETDAALQALQFEDMMTQLLQSVITKLESVRTACRTGNPAALTERPSPVTQQSLDAGSVELF
jgi:methyl-accepting chemotaxis protein